MCVYGVERGNMERLYYLLLYVFLSIYFLFIYFRSIIVFSGYFVY
jgi:hypothetical protein